MGPPRVVVLGIPVENRTQVPFTGDQKTVSALGTDCAYPWTDSYKVTTPVRSRAVASPPRPTNRLKDSQSASASP